MSRADRDSTGNVPEPIHTVQPLFPSDAAKKGVEGDVLVRVLIGCAGRVKQYRVEKPNPMFDAAAINAIRAWEFRPATANGEPVAMWMEVPIRFRR